MGRKSFLQNQFDLLVKNDEESIRIRRNSYLAGMSAVLFLAAWPYSVPLTAAGGIVYYTIRSVLRDIRK